jgi:hypothetical protein
LDENLAKEQFSRAYVHAFDKSDLLSITAAQLISYLRAKGWHKKDSCAYPSASIWVNKKKSDDLYEVMIPMEPSFRDYYSRVADAVKVLSIFEERSSNQIIYDLQNALKDVIRIRAVSQRTSRGTIPLSDGCNLLTSAKELIVAAASSSISPKANYPSRKADRVNEFLEKIELESSEKGSYIITISSSIPPVLNLPEHESEHATLEEPFERKVTMKLIQALAACKEASRQALDTGNIKAFDAAIKEGVSANLCDAIVNINQSSSNDLTEISVSWSLGRPVPKNTPSKVSFSSDLVSYIAEAARTFKEIKPVDEFELYGVVVRLTRKEKQTPGEIIVFELDGQKRKVSIELSEKDYKMAIQAHENLTPIYCIGELRKKGKVFSLFNYKNFCLSE